MRASRILSTIFEINKPTRQLQLCVFSKIKCPIVRFAIVKSFEFAERELKTDSEFCQRKNDTKSVAKLRLCVQGGKNLADVFYDFLSILKKNKIKFIMKSNFKIIVFNDENGVTYRKSKHFFLTYGTRNYQNYKIVDI